MTKFSESGPYCVLMVLIGALELMERQRSGASLLNVILTAYPDLGDEGNVANLSARRMPPTEMAALAEAREFLAFLSQLPAFQTSPSSEE